MTTIIEADSQKSYSIPTHNYQHDDEFHVAVRMSDYTTKNYTTKNSDGWKSRIRSFVKRVDDEADCRIRSVRVSHVNNGERLSQKKWTGDELSFTGYFSH
jgi:hypothetical protein